MHGNQRDKITRWTPRNITPISPKKVVLSLSFSHLPSPLLSASLAIMPTFSKIASPTLARDEYSSSPGGYRYEESLSLPPRQNLPEDDPTPRYHPASTSGYNHNARFSGSTSGQLARFSGSTSGQLARNSARARSLQNPPLSQRSPRSYISISSDDHDTAATELLILRNKNKELKLEIRHLQGRLEAMSYEPVIPIIFTY